MHPVAMTWHSPAAKPRGRRSPDSWAARMARARERVVGSRVRKSKGPGRERVAARAWRGEGTALPPSLAAAWSMRANSWTAPRKARSCREGGRVGRGHEGQGGVGGGG